MCGIYGATKQYTAPVIEKKISLMKSRGPDFQDFKILDKKITLGHTRLSIIDLDPRANQPFQYHHLSISFNGEIYNFLELKDDLIKKGYMFRTSSDTEVICASYLEYGDKCVEQFNGMFAFVIYDSKKNILFGARDRLGKKPFFYTLKNNQFEFASQLNTLAVENEFQIDEKAITDYLLWGYVPEPASIYKDVCKLKAGHKFHYNLSSKNFNDEKYWDIDYEWKNKFLGSYNEAVDELESLLENAINLRMISDVPLGIFLSGGIDSSLIAALAQKQSSAKVKTFSIKFSEGEFDESIYAAQVAKHINSDHTEILCDFNDGLDIIKNFSDYYDEPFADTSAIPMLILSKHTRKHVTVALSGDGGDESFLGYLRFKNSVARESLFKIPKFLRNTLSGLLDFSPKYKHKLIANGLRLNDISSLYYSYFTGTDKSWLNNVAPNYQFKELLYNESKPLIERFSDFDIKTFLNGDINTKVDKATMAYSLETRAPLMDYKVVDFARAIPSNYKIEGDNQKKILKEVLYKYVPKEIFDRPKVGFNVPTNLWYKNELKEYVLDILNEQSLKSIPNLNSKIFLQYVDNHMNNKWDHNTEIHRVLILMNWLQAR